MVKKKRKSENYRIGLYVRVSTEEQAKNLEGSIKNQQERLKFLRREQKQRSKFW